jgi:serine/threonine protein kinase
MNLRYRLQHSDIKPQNLFLVHHHIKVADFGLVKDLEGLKSPTNYCFSPLYAAPELFNGGASATSDQYSLAIVYQELLTGQRPFCGKSPRELLFQHAQQAPYVSPLPQADQPVVLRALAKEQSERFASCEEFVRGLRKATVERPASVISARPDPAASPAAAEQESPNNSKLSVLAESRALAAGYAVERGLCQVRCPNCGYSGRLPNRFKGLRIKCRVCHKAFVAQAALLLPATPVPAAPTLAAAADATRTVPPTRPPKEPASKSALSKADRAKA